MFYLMDIFRTNNSIKERDYIFNRGKYYIRERYNSLYIYKEIRPTLSKLKQYISWHLYNNIYIINIWFYKTINNEQKRNLNHSYFYNANLLHYSFFSEKLNFKKFNDKGPAIIHIKYNNNNEIVQYTRKYYLKGRQIFDKKTIFRMNTTNYEFNTYKLKILYIL